MNRGFLLQQQPRRGTASAAGGRRTSSGAGASSSQHTTRSWRQRCVEEFGLVELPSSWSAAAKARADSSTEYQWKQYYEARSRLHKDRLKYEQPRMRDEDDDDDGDKWSATNVYSVFEEQMEEILETLPSEASKAAWKSSLYFTVEGVEEDGGFELRNYDVQAILFSPFAIPRVLGMWTGYHYRERMNCCEFYLYCEFKMSDFGPLSRKKDVAGSPPPQRYPGDRIHQEVLAKVNAGRKGVMHVEDMLFTRDWFQGEKLCSNCFVDPPSTENEDIDQSCWADVQKIKVNNFSPTTVRRLRVWLLLMDLVATSNDAIASISDHSLMKLLLLPAYHDEFTEDHHSEPPSKEQLLELGYAEEVAETESEAGVWWLDYQLRLATQSLKPRDRFYQQYDEAGARTRWGEMVLEEAENMDCRCAYRGWLREKDEVLPQVIWGVAKNRMLDFVPLSYSDASEEEEEDARATRRGRRRDDDEEEEEDLSDADDPGIVGSAAWVREEHQRRTRAEAIQSFLAANSSLRPQSSKQRQPKKGRS